MEKKYLVGYLYGKEYIMFDEVKDFTEESDEEGNITISFSDKDGTYSYKGNDTRGYKEVNGKAPFITSYKYMGRRTAKRHDYLNVARQEYIPDENSSFNRPTSQEHRYDVLVCDGNGAASRGTEDDGYYEVSADGPDFETALREELFEYIWGYDLEDYFDQDKLNNPDFSVWEYIQAKFDISGGEQFIICILEDNNEIYKLYEDEFVEDIMEYDEALTNKYFPNYTPSDDIEEDYDSKDQICDGCGEYFDDLRDGLTGGHYCDDCWDRLFFECEECGEEGWKENAKEGPDGQLYCDDCWEDLYTNCSGCNKVIGKEEANYCYDNDEYYCPDCWEYYFFTCAKCGEVFDRNDGYIVDQDDKDEKWLCPDCYGEWDEDHENENLNESNEKCYTLSKKITIDNAFEASIIPETDEDKFIEYGLYSKEKNILTLRKGTKLIYKSNFDVDHFHFEEYSLPQYGNLILQIESDLLNKEFKGELD